MLALAAACAPLAPPAGARALAVPPLALAAGERLAHPRVRAPCASVVPTGDASLVAAMEALRSDELQTARVLLLEARQLYEERDELTGEREQLLSMVQTRIDSAQRRSELSKEDALQALKAKAVATKLAAKLGPVGWEPTIADPQQRNLVQAGDAAMNKSINALGMKDFMAAYEALNEAQDAFRQAGSDIEEARAQTIENVYAHLRAEMERNDRLKKLIRELTNLPSNLCFCFTHSLFTKWPSSVMAGMKEILNKKKALALQDELDQRSADKFV